MNIKEFVEESLKQIVEGISDSNNLLKNSGAYIPSEMLIGEGVLFQHDKDKQRTRNFVKVEFDLAITVTESDATKANGGLSVANIFNAGTSFEDNYKSERISRVKFTIPLGLPQ